MTKVVIPYMHLWRLYTFSLMEVIALCY